jgi:ArsR family transcriptional regulator, arsenate/arsenite/antimonite-responsive transcriptional repressor
MQSLSTLSTVMGALSDRTRLRLYSLIVHNGEICVCDLIDITGLPQSKVSRHLSVLRHAGLVTDRREGQWMHYSASRAGSATSKTLLKLIRDAHLEFAELHADLVALATSSCCQLPARTLVQVELPRS